MSNRVPCEYVDGRLYALGTEIHGMQPRTPASVGSFVLRLRLRPEKVRLVTDVVDLLPGEAGTTSEGVPCGLGNEAVSVAARRLGVVAFVALLCYFVVLPVMRLQATAFEDGAAGFGRVFGLPRIGQILWNTVGLAFGSLVIAMVLGTALAWAANRLPAPSRLATAEM
ncbi:hypothetical protein [Rhodococcus phenolicus]|uniref:hypothetical protein n=1 Tax=Rhodococcus phenolicus TaxID=263849 RepID=UPI000B318296|nr:hypothetical protein [Rhodococcus phenolicus]